MDLKESHATDGIHGLFVTLLMLAVTRERLVTIAEVLTAFDISEAHLMKVANALARARNAFYEELERHSLADLAARSPKLRRFTISERVMRRSPAA